jgi:hypothetical protein
VKYDFWNHPEPARGEGGEAVSRIEGEVGKAEASSATLEREGNGVVVPGRGADDRPLWL